MKRFMIFAYSDAGNSFGAEGGMSDFVGTANTLTEGFNLAIQRMPDAYSVEAVDLVFNTLMTRLRPDPMSRAKWGEWTTDVVATEKLRELEPRSMLKPDYGEAATLDQRKRKFPDGPTWPLSDTAEDAPSPKPLNLKFFESWAKDWGKHVVHPEKPKVEIPSFEEQAKSKMEWSERTFQIECETEFGKYRIVPSVSNERKYLLRYHGKGHMHGNTIHRVSIDDIAAQKSSEVAGSLLDMAIARLKDVATKCYAERLQHEFKAAMNKPCLGTAPMIEIVHTDEVPEPSIMGENCRFGVSIKNGNSFMLVFQNIGTYTHCLTDRGLYTIVPQTGVNVSTGQMMDQTFAVWFNYEVTVGNKAQLTHRSIESRDEAMRLVTEHYAKN